MKGKSCQHARAKCTISVGLKEIIKAFKGAKSCILIFLLPVVISNLSMSRIILWTKYEVTIIRIGNYNSNILLL